MILLARFPFPLPCPRPRAARSVTCRRRPSPAAVCAAPAAVQVATPPFRSISRRPALIALGRHCHESRRLPSSTCLTRLTRSGGLIGMPATTFFPGIWRPAEPPDLCMNQVQQCAHTAARRGMGVFWAEVPRQSRVHVAALAPSRTRSPRAQRLH